LAYTDKFQRLRQKDGSFKGVVSTMDPSYPLDKVTTSVHLYHAADDALLGLPVIFSKLIEKADL
jgi:hypothetical protein